MQIWGGRPWLCAVLVAGLGCSVQRVPVRDPATSSARAPYDFEAEKAAPPPPAVAPAPAGARLDSETASLETPVPVDLGAPSLRVQDLAAPAAANPPPASATDAPMTAPAAPGASRGRGSAGFRVQIFATTDAAAAERMRREVEARLGVRAYVEFDAPYHKVRVGNCATSDACRELQTRLRGAGYTSVWAVPATIEP